MKFYSWYSYVCWSKWWRLSWNNMP